MSTDPREFEHPIDGTGGTVTPETIPTKAVGAARAALEQRLSWASLDWPNLYPNMIDAIIGTVVPAAAPFIAAQAKGEALREAAAGMDEKAEKLRVVSQDRDACDFNTRTRYAAYAEEARTTGHWLRARAATIESEASNV